MGKRSKEKARRKQRKLERERAERAADGVTLPAEELAARLVSLSSSIDRRLGRATDEDGLTRARLSALAVLVLGGPKRLGALAEAEGVRPPTMTRLVDAMSDDGLVERRADPADGRSVIIAATPAGERLLDGGRSRRIAPLTEAIDELAPDEAAVVARSTDLLARVLRDVDRKAGR